MKSLVMKCVAVALLLSSVSYADEIVYDNDWRAGETSLISHDNGSTCSACETCGWY